MYTDATTPTKYARSQPPDEAHREHDAEEDRVAGHHGGHVEAAEEDGGGADAELHVVVAIDHRVLGVVGDGPEDVGGEQRPASGGTSPVTAANAIGMPKPNAHAQPGLRAW
jgi:hypothetical protein